KAMKDVGRVHAWLDELQGNAALDRFGLLGHPDGSHAAFAELLQELVRADYRAGSVAGRGRFHGQHGIDRGRLSAQEPAGGPMGPQQGLQPRSKFLVVATSLVEIRCLRLRRGRFQGLGEKREHLPVSIVHGKTYRECNACRGPGAWLRVRRLPTDLPSVPRFGGKRASRWQFFYDYSWSGPLCWLKAS